MTSVPLPLVVFVWLTEAMSASGAVPLRFGVIVKNLAGKVTVFDSKQQGRRLIGQKEWIGERGKVAARIRTLRIVDRIVVERRGVADRQKPADRIKLNVRREDMPTRDDIRDLHVAP